MLPFQKFALQAILKKCALYSRACEEDFISEFKDGESRGRLALVVPEGGIGPEDTNAAVRDNLFETTGYRYKRTRRNIFSGKVEEAQRRECPYVEKCSDS